MGKIRVLAGKEIVAVLIGFGFSVVSQKGSHVKMARVIEPSERQVLTIPLHDELDKGTVRAICRQALKYIPEESLRQHFFHE